MKQRIADYIADFFVARGIDTVFTVVGGGSMHLNDAFGKNEGLVVYHNHHEQACAMAAEGYARINEKPAVVCVTTGPGGTNALTGVLGAYQDNVPMIVISGQVRQAISVEKSGLKLRQFADQEYCIIESARSMTKYAEVVRSGDNIKYMLEKAFFIAMNGRRGPVWLDIPLNIQGMEIDTDTLDGYKTTMVEPSNTGIIDEVLDKLKYAKSPLILAGAGIRRADAYKSFYEAISKMNIPVVSPTFVADILPVNHSMYYGHFGILGERTGNFLVQNADIILSVGCRLSPNQIGYNYEKFATRAYKIVVDIDKEELKKKTIKIDLPVNMDLKEFFVQCNAKLSIPWKKKESWIRYANALKERFNIFEGIRESKDCVHSYLFIRELMNVLPDDGVIVTGNSASAAMALHYGTTKVNQRLFSNRGCGSMGYDLPAAIGASIASKKDVICFTGDGSLQMNIQELQTIVTNKLPIKVFVINNNGYRGVVRTQETFFEGRLTGCTPSSGLMFPSLEKIAYAYGIPFVKFSNMNEIRSRLKEVLFYDGYIICEIIGDIHQGPAFKTTSKKMPNGEFVSAPLDELSPKLDEKTYQQYRYYKAQF